jgi:2-polyprenyl-6-methoxyphenol hydroxylase-like FAD-dependent oxidoreductase
LPGRFEPRVLVIGAGIGGLAAGAALGRKGIPCDIVEIRPVPEVYGVGINQPGNSLRALDRIGVLDAVLAVGFQFDGWDFHGPDGELAVGIDSHLGDDRVPHNNGLSRRDLHTILLGAARDAGAEIRFGATVTEVHEDGGAAHVVFSDGRIGRYDLIAAFDGVKSAQRERVFEGRYRPVYAGVVIWRVTIPRPEGVVRGVVYQSVDAKAGCIPLSQDDMYLFLVTPESRDVRVDKARVPQMLRERLQSFGGLIGEIRDALDDDDDVVYSPLDEVMLPAPWSKERIVICGDAAHACAPHITQGAGMALEDAVVLADELSRADSLAEALRAFNERRYPRAKFVQDVSRAILDAEMSVTHETLPMALQRMRQHLPEQMAQVDSVLLQPA